MRFPLPSWPLLADLLENDMSVEEKTSLDTPQDRRIIKFENESPWKMTVSEHPSGNMVFVITAPGGGSAMRISPDQAEALKEFL